MSNEKFNKGAIVVSRDLINEPVFANPNLLKAWIYCLMKANFKQKWVSLRVGKGFTEVEVQRGTFIYGRNKTAENLQLTASQTQTLFDKLAKFKYISIESSNQYSIVTILDYNELQSLNNYKTATNLQPTCNQSATNRQPIDNQPATNNTTNNDNNDNNEKNDNKVCKSGQNKILHPPKKTIEIRKSEFKNSAWKKITSKYPEVNKNNFKDFKDFYEYWVEHGEKDKKMRFEKEKSFGIVRRFSTWTKNKKTFGKKQEITAINHNSDYE